MSTKEMEEAEVVMVIRKSEASRSIDWARSSVTVKCADCGTDCWISHKAAIVAKNARRLCERCVARLYGKKVAVDFMVEHALKTAAQHAAGKCHWGECPIDGCPNYPGPIQ